MAWSKHSAARWTPTTQAKVRARLEADAFPLFGATPIAEIRAKHVQAAVLAVESCGASETAARLLQRVRAVFRYAVSEELIESNPMLDLKAGEILKPRAVEHRAALPEAELPAFLAQLDAYEGEPTTVQYASSHPTLDVPSGPCDGEWEGFSPAAATDAAATLRRGCSYASAAGRARPSNTPTGRAH